MKPKEAKQVSMAGQMMSNWLFNIAQSRKNNFTDHERRQMLDMVATWDCAERLLTRSKKKASK